MHPSSSSSSSSFESDTPTDPPPRDLDIVGHRGISNPSRHPSAPPFAAISALSLREEVILLPLCVRRLCMVSRSLFYKTLIII